MSITHALTSEACSPQQLVQHVPTRLGMMSITMIFVSQHTVNFCPSKHCILTASFTVHPLPIYIVPIMCVLPVLGSGGSIRCGLHDSENILFVSIGTLYVSKFDTFGPPRVNKLPGYRLLPHFPRLGRV